MQTKKKILSFKKIFLLLATSFMMSSCGLFGKPTQDLPTETPTVEPTESPTETPSVDPTEDPTEVPSINPTDEPTLDPTEQPTDEPTVNPTEQPTDEPTEVPTVDPTIQPTETPTEIPTEDPTEIPTESPTETPTEQPTEIPTESPTDEPIIEPKEVNFDVYTINDFHGATYYVNDTYPQIGLAKLATVFHGFEEENTSFFISSGDMWQETIESNSNYGAYVTEAMNYIGFDAMTIGNHEFDWGPDKIIANAEIAEFPFLGANIKEKETGYLMESLETSTIIEKDGVSVGIIGTIGPAQYNSISAQQVYDYEFENEYNIVVNEAKNLRENGAEVIIWSSHDSFSNNDLTAVKKSTIDDAKIDMVIAGHSHQLQNDTYSRSDGQKVPLIQAYSKGTAYGHVNFTYNNETEKLTLVSQKVPNFKNFANVEEDQYILDLYKNKYDVDDIKNEVLCTLNGELGKNAGGVLGSTAIYEAITNDPDFAEYDILCAYNTDCRKSISSGEMTYEELFQAFPFDNEIILYQVNASYISRGYYNFQKGFDKNVSFSGKRWIAGVDYLAYKYIDVGTGIRTGLYVRDLAKDYVTNKKVINASDY